MEDTASHTDRRGLPSAIGIPAYEVFKEQYAKLDTASLINLMDSYYRLLVKRKGRPAVGTDLPVGMVVCALGLKRDKRAAEFVRNFVLRDWRKWARLYPASHYSRDVSPALEWRMWALWAWSAHEPKAAGKFAIEQLRARFPAKTSYDAFCLGVFSYCGSKPRWFRMCLIAALRGVPSELAKIAPQWGWFKQYSIYTPERLVVTNWPLDAIDSLFELLRNCLGRKLPDSKVPNYLEGALFHLPDPRAQELAWQIAVRRQHPCPPIDAYPHPRVPTIKSVKMMMEKALDFCQRFPDKVYAVFANFFSEILNTESDRSVFFAAENLLEAYFLACTGLDYRNRRSIYEDYLRRLYRETEPLFRRLVSNMRKSGKVGEAELLELEKLFESLARFRFPVSR